LAPEANPRSGFAATCKLPDNLLNIPASTFIITGNSKFHAKCGFFELSEAHFPAYSAKSKTAEKYG
jgi:hypothetical protein